MVTFYIVSILILIALIYLLSEIFFYCLINFSTAEVTEKQFSVKIFRFIKIFSVDLPDIKLFSTSKDLTNIRSLGYRASRVVRGKNLLVIIYERSLFGSPNFPKQEFEQVIITKNSIEVIDDLEKQIPQAIHRSKTSN